VTGFWLAALGVGSAEAGDKRDAVLDVLQAFEERLGEGDLARLGDGVDAELMAIGDDPGVAATRRANAVVALQWYRTDAVRAWLVRRLHGAAGTPADSLLRRKAARALGAFGAAAIPELSAALADADVQVRVAAAIALGSMKEPGAREALKARLPAESDPTAHAALEAQLRQP
jgi:HEAT repeat protein